MKMKNLSKIVEDKEITEAFIKLVIKRVKEKHPSEDIRAEDVSVKVEVKLLNGSAQMLRTLRDMVNEGIGF